MGSWSGGHTERCASCEVEEGPGKEVSEWGSCCGVSVHLTDFGELELADIGYWTESKLMQRLRWKR